MIVAPQMRCLLWSQSQSNSAVISAVENADVDLPFHCPSAILWFIWVFGENSFSGHVGLLK
jgi:hypothetical protein